MPFHGAFHPDPTRVFYPDLNPWPPMQQNSLFCYTPVHDHRRFTQATPSQGEPQKRRVATISRGKGSTLPEYLEAHEVSALIAAAPNPQARLLTLEKWRAGLRVAEALALEPRDLRLDTDRPTVRIREGKGQKSREVPVHPELQAAIIAATSYGAVGAAPWSTFHGRRPGGGSSWRQSERLMRASWTAACTSALTRCGTATPVTCC